MKPLQIFILPTALLVLAGSLWGDDSSATTA